jgi:hypothetical protein
MAPVRGHWGERAAALVLLAALAGAGCATDTRYRGVSPGALDGGATDGGVGASDAGTDAASPVCVAGATFCAGRVLHTCNATGSGPDPALDLTCEFTCADGACAFASNVPAALYALCDATAPALTPPAGATVRIEDPGVPRLTCAPDCGDGVTTVIDARGIFPQASGPTLAVFCLSALDLPAGASLAVAPLNVVDDAIAFLVDGPATITGDVVLDGGNADATFVQGAGGPGGGAGGALSGFAGNPGGGACGGAGGGITTLSDSGGGGGGGGGGGSGGIGGNGRDAANTNDAAGGLGAAACLVPELVPLAGGSGGGGGGDGQCGGSWGLPGGGGGGALSVASRVSVTVTGTMSAAGGGGLGMTTNGGGGGGGSGGALLLEAPSVSVSGSLRVDGGAGGLTAAGAGGSGASGASLDGGGGTSWTAAPMGGSGGGGGGGRVRLGSGGAAAACGAFVSPSGSCSAGTMRTTP